MSPDPDFTTPQFKPEPLPAGFDLPGPTSFYLAAFSETKEAVEKKN